MPRDVLLAWVHAAGSGVLQIDVADLALRQRDAGVLEEDVREGHDARGGVGEGDQERDEEEKEAAARLHGVAVGARGGLRLRGSWS